MVNKMKFSKEKQLLFIVQNLTFKTQLLVKHFLKNVQYVLLGVDKENNFIRNKPLIKTAIDEGILSK